MEIYVKISFITILIFFLFSNMILTDALILPILQLQIQQVMTSQIRSHRILKTDLLHSFTHFVGKMYEKFSLNDCF